MIKDDFHSGEIHEIPYKKYTMWDRSKELGKRLKRAILGLTRGNSRTSRRTLILNTIAYILMVMIFVILFQIILAIITIGSLPTSKSEAGKLAAVENCKVLLKKYE